MAGRGSYGRENQVAPIDSIVEIGRIIRFLSPLTQSSASLLDDRQVDALGIVHDRVRNLSVGVVGDGGLGSPIAEQLVRMGVAEVFIIDHDALDTESNVRRVFGAKQQDIGENSLKVEVVGQHLDDIGLNTQVYRIAGDVREEKVFRNLLDTDVGLNATDTHGSRATVNEPASTYLLPVIDVGVRFGAKAGNRLCALVAEVRVLTPTTPCLWCRGTISADVIRTESLPTDERERLEQEGYVTHGFGAPAPSVAALTILGSGLATMVLLALLTEEGEVSPSGYVVDGFLGDSITLKPIAPNADCRCRRQLGLGDASPPPFILIPDQGSEEDNGG